MHTQCPHCQTIFRVNAAHLNVAQGHVRCSRCRNVFNAANHLVKDLPPKGNSQATFSTADGSDEETESDFPELLKEDYVFARRHSWGSTFFWGLVSIIFLVTLAGQYVWWMQPELILQNPQARPWLDRFCYTFICTLPSTRNLKSFQMKKQAVVQTHPEVPNAIQVDATFENDASFPQPYPILQLTFQDVNGTPIAQRRFTPADYLHTEVTEEMKAHASVHVRLELVDMEGFLEGEKVMVGYTFDFL